MGTKTIRGDLAALGFLILLITALFADVLFLGRGFYERDLIRFYYPTRHLVRGMIQAGEFPVWNPFLSGGQPLAANPDYSVFYPPQWLTLLPDYHHGFHLWVLLHFYVAALGMYGLLRSTNAGRTAGVFGAITFSLGGPILSQLNLLPIFFIFAWLPLMLLFARRFLLSAAWKDFAAASLILGLQCLVGEPTSLIQITLLLFGCATYLGFRRNNMATCWSRAVMILVAGVAVGAVQLVPAMDLARDSVRSRGFSFSLVETWSLPPQRIAELVYPNFFGIASAGTDLFWGHRMYPRRGYPFMNSLYLGMACASFLLAGLLARIRASLWIAGGSIAALLVAFGSHTPLLRVMYDAGLHASFRYPEKWSMAALFALTILGARAVDEVVRGNRRVLRFATGIAAVAAAAALVLWARTAIPGYAERFSEFWRVPPEWAEIAGDQWALAFIRGLLLTLLLAAALRNLVSPRLFAVGLISFCLLDLLPIIRAQTPRLPRSFFTAPPIASRLDADKNNYRIFHQADWYSDAPTANRYLDYPGARYFVFRNAMFPVLPALWGYHLVLNLDYDQTNLLPTAELIESMWKVKESGQQAWARMFMTMSDARYLVLLQPFERGFKGGVESVEPAVFLEAPDTPRYWFADRLIRASSPAEFVAGLSRGDWSATTAYVQSPEFKPEPARVLSVRERSSRVEIEVEARGKSFLVISITPHRYWRATVAGRPTPLERANVGYQGLTVPPGRHRVELRYRNPVILWSGGVSVVSCVVLLGMLLRKQILKKTAGVIPSVSEGSVVCREARDADSAPHTHHGSLAVARDDTHESFS